MKYIYIDALSENLYITYKIFGKEKCNSAKIGKIQRAKEKNVLTIYWLFYVVYVGQGNVMSIACYCTNSCCLNCVSSVRTFVH